MTKVVKTELEKLKVKQNAPDKAIDLVTQAAQKLADFKTRITSIHDELTALSSYMSSSGEFKKAETDEVEDNLAEIVAVKTAIDLLDL